MQQDHIDIIATLGPASLDPNTIKQMVNMGATVFRFNFSHINDDNYTQFVRAARTIREIDPSGENLKILADLQGPKIRIGEFAEGPINLELGQRFRLDNNPARGDSTRVHLPHPEVLAALEVGKTVQFQDGTVTMRVVETGDGYAEMEVVSGSRLRSKVGLNLPDLDIPIPCLTEKDLMDMELALSDDIGANIVAVSFVQSAADVEQAKQLIGGRAAVMAKIEKPQAIADIDRIIDASDAVMVARGDLAVETPMEELYFLQREILQKAREAGVYSVVATQVLETMIENETPIRPESTGVGQALEQGANALMLSGETATGKHPVRCIETLKRHIDVALDLLNNPERILQRYRKPVPENAQRPDQDSPINPFAISLTRG